MSILAHGTLNAFPTVLVAICGAFTGVFSMLLYGRISPQERLSLISARVSEARAELNRFDGADGQMIWSLARRAVILSLQQVGLTFVPTLVAMLPVLVIVAFLEHWFGLSDVVLWSQGPAWLATGHTAFWLPLGVAALVVKWKLKIT